MMTKFLGGFICGAFCGAVIVYMLWNVGDGVIRTMYVSAVDTPVRIALDDIIATYDRKEQDLAEAKIRLLRDRWYDYLEKNEQPHGLGDVHIDISRLTLEGQPTDAESNPAHKKAE